MQKIKTCIFPVAGLGTRFLPATKSIPKEMLVVVDKPLIQYAVEEARSAGITRFVFITSMGKSAIEDHFDSIFVLEETLKQRNKNHELELIQSICLNPGQAIYVRQHKPMGLGHAVLCAQSLIDEDAFCVILADDLVLSNKPCLKQMIESYQHNDGNMVGVMNVDRKHVNRYGILNPFETIGEKIFANNVIEKPSINSAPSNIAIIGRYILKKEIFNFLKTQKQGTGNEIQLTDSIQSMLPATKLCGFQFEGKRFDCGTKQGWLEANIAFALDDPNLRSHVINSFQNSTVK